jgi:hypothetical protein
MGRQEITLLGRGGTIFSPISHFLQCFTLMLTVPPTHSSPIHSPQDLGAQPGLWLQGGLADPTD